MRCLICERPSALFGNRDVDTGWMGWCDICNLRWHSTECTRLERLKLLNTFPVAGELERVRIPAVARRHILECLAGSFQKRLYLIHQRARMNAWWRILYERAGSSILIRDDTDGQVRECDTDDESESGVFDAYLNFVNPLWKLKLARPLGSRPVEIVMTMLGKPPT